MKCSNTETCRIHLLETKAVSQMTSCEYLIFEWIPKDQQVKMQTVKKFKCHYDVGQLTNVCHEFSNGNFMRQETQRAYRHCGSGHNSDFTISL